LDLATPLRLHLEREIEKPAEYFVSLGVSFFVGEFSSALC